MKDNIFIIDLEQTLIMIKRALTFIKKICLNRGYIFYVPSFLPASSPKGGQPGDSGIGSYSIHNNIENKIKSFPSNLQENNLIFLSPEFISSSKQRGMLYAFTQKRKNLSSFASFSPPVITENSADKEETPGIAHSSKSAALASSGATSDASTNSSATKKNTNLGFFFKPEALFLLNCNNNTALIKEAIKLQIPIVGIVDSDSNIFGIRYPIPGNDDTLETQKIYTELLLNTIIDAKKKEAQLLLYNKN